MIRGPIPAALCSRAQPGSVDPGTIVKRRDPDPGARAALARLSPLPLFFPPTISPGGSRTDARAAGFYSSLSSMISKTEVP
jgi:hypothetical protein